MAEYNENMDIIKNVQKSNVQQPSSIGIRNSNTTKVGTVEG